MKYSETNLPLECLMTQSTCYKGTKAMKPVGVLWHSTGANNKTIKRYVQPSDNDPNREELLKIIGVNKNGNDWNHKKRNAGVNAFIGTLADGTVAAVQVLDWDDRPWGCGSGKKGTCNDGWLQFEICEDNLKDKEYFEKVYKEACELTALYCKMYDINPMGSVSHNSVTVPTILCHQDSYKLKLGSNHSDVYPWFKKYGKTMENVRKDVAALMETIEVAPAPTPAPIKPAKPSKPTLRRGDNNEEVKTLQKTLKKLGFDPNGIDGKFGPGTEAAVIGFQNERDLDPDGVCGPKTWREIEAFAPYNAVVTASKLNIRTGPSTLKKSKGTYKKNTKVCIVYEKNGWGKLDNGTGWVSLKYIKKA